ncbi:ATP-binding cassette domain-containing protein [Acidisoma cellulosilytica]|uniref:ATP-binding cassette domain-containing protein n=1 Tax=Acidisoma cellulosilyticum TaxID=2802395 RepID=A0A964E5A5_9PROT|nr:ATP-binding cassette domain-containing protein [Acidisoma cellulosilyticum]MCB8881778.1 ATP-binding cassette domain-containing protein [Acidisoma cellulosilyticum]
MKTSIAALTLQERNAEHGTDIQAMGILEEARASGDEGMLFDRLMDQRLRLANAEQASERLKIILECVTVFTQHGMSLVVLGIGALEIIHARLTYGDLVAFQMLAELFANPLNRLTGAGAALQSASSAVVRLQDVLKADMPQSASQESGGRLAGTVALDKVTLTDAHGIPLLQGLTFEISQPGEIVAISGPPGSGKSLLLNLIAGTLAPEDGQVTIGGAPIAALLVALICQALFQMGQKFALSRLEARSGLDLQAALVDRAMRLPADAFRKSTPVILATQLESIAKFRSDMVHFAISGGVALVNGLVAAVVMAFFQLQAAAVAMVLGLLLSVIAAVFGWRQFRAIYEGERMDIIVLAFVYDLVQLVPVVRAMAGERASFIQWAQNFLAFQSRIMRSTSLSNAYSTVASVWEPLMLLTCFAAIAFAGSKEALGVGAALGFISALGRFAGATQGVAAAVFGVTKSLPMAKLSKSFLDTHLMPVGFGEPLAKGAGADRIVRLSEGKIDAVEEQNPANGTVAST